MTVDVSAISRRLDIPPEELVKKGVLSYVIHEIRQSEWETSEIKERYGVSSTGELENQIKTGAVYSHPAWEDLIRWENLDDYISRLRAIEEELRLAA